MRSSRPPEYEVGRELAWASSVGNPRCLWVVDAVDNEARAYVMRRLNGPYQGETEPMPIRYVERNFTPVLA